jgi:hypothetical protein
MKINSKIENFILPKLTQETCKLLNTKKNELLKLNWQTGESNTDIDFSNLSKKCCEIAFSNINDINELKLKISVPDLKLEFIYNKNTYYKKIELKSTKSINSKIPGSMIKSLDPNTWTIMCYRAQKENEVEVRYGRYFIGMEVSPFEKFQDRSPRPSLNFIKFQKYNETPKISTTSISKNFWKDYAKAAIKRILEPQQHSWQDDLVKEIIKLVLKNPNKFKDI